MKVFLSATVHFLANRKQPGTIYPKDPPLVTYFIQLRSASKSSLNQEKHDQLGSNTQHTGQGTGTVLPESSHWSRQTVWSQCEAQGSDNPEFLLLIQLVAAGEASLVKALSPWIPGSWRPSYLCARVLSLLQAAEGGRLPSALTAAPQLEQKTYVLGLHSIRDVVTAWPPYRNQSRC